MRQWRRRARRAMWLRLGGGLQGYLLFPDVPSSPLRREALHTHAEVIRASFTLLLVAVKLWITICNVHSIKSWIGELSRRRRRVENDFQSGKLRKINNFIKTISSSHFCRAMCSPSQGPCCTAECSLKYGDKCRDDNGCRDPSYCDGRMPHCPPSVNKPNKTICNKEFVCFMGVSWTARVVSNSIGINQFRHSQTRRNAPGQSAWHTDWNRANAFRDRVIRKPSPASCAVKSPARTITARARSSGTKRLMMFPICMPSPARLATTTSDIATCSRNVEKSIHPDR